MYNTYSQLLLLLAFPVLQSCSSGVPDVDPVDVSIKRFEQDFFSLDTLNLEASLQTLEEKYPVFYPFFISQIMGFAKEGDSAILNNVRTFLSNQAIQELYKTCTKQFLDLLPIEKELGDAFGRFKYYFPDQSLPEVYSIISEFGNAAFTVEASIVGIGLDLYLGKDYRYYNSVGFPFYMIRRLEKNYIVSNTIQVMLSNLLELSPKNLLDEMIYYGKVFYFMDLILPEVQDSIKIGYTAAQLDWCEKNDIEIWTFFIKQNLLFSSDVMLYGKYVREGPSSSGMPPESPGNIGSWVGWQIVRKYMENNPETTIPELIVLKGQDLLNRSRYKPGRIL